MALTISDLSQKKCSAYGAVALGNAVFIDLYLLDALTGEDRGVLKLRPGITGPASLKYRNEEELLATVDDSQRYNDEVIFPDKVRINRYYLHHYSFWMDLKMIVAMVLGRRMVYGGEVI